MTKPLIALFMATASAPAWSQTLSFHEALASANQNRPAVRAARLDLEQSRRSARALGRYPATLLSLGYSSRNDLGATDQDFVISQPVDVFGRTGAGQRLGRAHLEVGEANFRRALLEVQSDVLRNYFQAAVSVSAERVSTELLALAETLHNVTLRRYELGQIPEVQLTRAKIELDLAAQAQALRQAQRKAAEKRLSSALGLKEVPEPVEPTAVMPTATAVDPKHRPDVLLFAAKARVADAEANFVSKSGLPELELQGLRSPWRESGSTTGARLQLTVPLFDHGRRRDESAAARLQASSARAQLEDARRTATAQLEAIEIERQSAASRVASFERIQQSARTLVDRAQRGFSEGFGTMVDVLETSRALREIEQQLAEARLELNLIEIERYEAAGILLEEMN